MRKLSVVLIIFALIMCLVSCGNNTTLESTYETESTHKTETTDDTSTDTQTKDETNTDTADTTSLPDSSSDIPHDTDTSSDTGDESSDTGDEDESSDTVQSTDTQESSSDKNDNDDKKDDEKPKYDYSIIYELNGGHFDGEVPNGYYSSTGADISTKPVREGYKFYGWINKNTGECVDKITIPQGSKKDIEFFAIWYTDIDKNGFVLRNDGGTYTLVWYSGTKTSAVNIPESFNSMPVTKIDSYAFYYRKDIVRVIIPLSINEFGSYVFEKAIGMLVSLKDTKQLDAWLDKLISDETNIQAIEVIKGERAAIGFSKWI